SPDRALQAQGRETLTQSLATLAQVHRGLTQGDESLNLSGYCSPAIQRLYFDPPVGVDRQVRAYVAAGQELLATAEGDRSLHHPALQDILTTAPQVLAALDRVVTQYEQESQEAALRFQTQLIQAQRLSSINQLIDGVTYELTNPVNVLCGNLPEVHHYGSQMLDLLHLYRNTYPQASPAIDQALATLDLDFATQDFPDALAALQTHSNRIRQLVFALRSFCRPDQSQHACADINAGLDSVLLLLRSRWDHKLPHQKIEVKKQYQVLPPVNCYPEQLNWVFINLINNAIEALETTSEITSEITSATTANQRRPRQITITTAMRPQGHAPALAQQPTIVIQVADTGPGVAPAIQSQLFQPFTT
uniref:sensor histidine kinase n=1 Tax=Prochlorothrix hollandica TaxID=1223 RepID=UPI00333EC7B8